MAIARPQSIRHQGRPGGRIRFRLTEDLVSGSSAAAKLVTVYPLDGTLLETADNVIVYDADNVYSGSTDDFGKAEWWPDSQRFEIYDLHCCHPYAVCELARDIFDRSDDTDLGSDWSEVAGDGEILDQKLHIATADTIILHTTTHPDNPRKSFVEVVVSGAAGDVVRVFVNYTDADNYHFVELSISETRSCLSLNSRVAGTNTVLARRYVSVVPDVSVTIQVWFGDGRFMAGLGSPPYIYSPLRVAATGTGNKVGLGSGSTATDINFTWFAWERMASEDHPECRMPPQPCELFRLSNADDSPQEDSTNVGCSWSEFSGEWSLDANQLTTSDPDAVILSLINWDDPALAIAFTMYVEHEDIGNSLRLLMDYVDDDNYIYIEIDTADGESYEVGGGVPAAWVRVVVRVAGTDTLAYETHLGFVGEDDGVFHDTVSFEACLAADGLLQVTCLVGMLAVFSFAVQLDPPTSGTFGFATGAENTGPIWTDVTVRQAGAEDCVVCEGEPCENCYVEEQLPDEIELEMDGWGAGEVVDGAGAAMLNGTFALLSAKPCVPQISCDWGVDPRTMLNGQPFLVGGDGAGSVRYTPDGSCGSVFDPIVSGIPCACIVEHDPETDEFVAYAQVFMADTGTPNMQVIAAITLESGICAGHTFVFTGTAEGCDWEEVELTLYGDFDGLVPDCATFADQVQLIDFGAVTVVVRRA